MSAALKLDFAELPLVLIALPVEDEREMYDAHLQFDGFRTVLALDYAELLDKARRLRPDTIVIGQRLPPGGEQVCSELKADADTASIPTVLIASYSVPKADAEAVLVRPVLPPALSETLRLLVKKSGHIVSPDDHHA
jgi:DNA-binding response OmpR family regulator